MSSTTPIISDKVYDVSILSMLTNEIPHLSIYDILNRQLKSTWSRELIGKAVNYHGTDFESQKSMNGNISKNYTAREFDITDPVSGEVKVARVEKINFSVDGAIETEIDYLMHEYSRYLSKLYPDDLHAVVTLTEAERQSYFNEALHMLHSYFDTEQIVATDADDPNYRSIADMYFRYKFLTGITPIRSLTGVSQQEEALLSLLNTNNVNIYTGYEVFVSPEQNYIISNREQLDTDSSTRTLDAYYFANSTTVKKKSSTKLQGKTKDTGLEEFIKDSIVNVPISPDIVKQLCKSFTVIPSTDPLELVEDLIHGQNINSNGFNINEMLANATRSNALQAGATVQALQNTTLGSTVLDWKSNEVVFPVLSSCANTSELTFYDKNLNIRNPIDLENRIIASTYTTLQDIDKSRLLKLTKASYSQEVLLAVGNLVYSSITQQYSSSQAFKTTYDSAIANRKLIFVASVYQDDQLIFGGLLDTGYLETCDPGIIVNLNTATNFDARYSAESLFEAYGFRSNVDKNCLDLSQTLQIRIGVALLQDENIKNGAIAFSKLEGNTEYRFVCTQRDNDALDVRVYVDDDIRDPNSTKTKLIGNTVETDLRVISEDSRDLVGTASLSGNQLSIELLEKIGSGKKVSIFKDVYNIPVLSEISTDSDTHVTDSTDKVCGKYVICKIDNVNYIDTKALDLLRDSKGWEKVYETLISTTEVFKSEAYKVGANVVTGFESVNVLNIGVEYYDTILEAIVRNTKLEVKTLIDTVNGKDYYVYSSFYDLAVQGFAKPNAFINLTEISKLLFTESSAELYKLRSCKAYFYADNIVCTTEDVADEINKLGRVNCLILDCYGTFYPVRAKSARVKNDQCYIFLEESVDGLVNLDSRDGLIILDTGTTIDLQEIDTIKKTRRKAKLGQTYKYGNNLRFYKKHVWEDLSRDHLNFSFNNIYSPSVEQVYADNSELSRVTNIPSSLSYQENLTILNGADKASVDLFEDLLAENRSLYLDSSIRFLVNVPLSTKTLVYNPDYEVTSYTYGSALPATITFYSYANWQAYEPLQEFIATAKSESSSAAVNTEVQVMRREIIWGSVVWDANESSRSIKTLRTIWSSYFANFEIFETDDILPPEAFIQTDITDTDNLSVKTLNVLNYNFAENDGAAAVLWSLSSMLNANGIEKTLVNVVDAFSHKKGDFKGKVQTYIPRSKTSTEEGDVELYLNSFSIPANRFVATEDSSSTKLVNAVAPISNLVLDTELDIDETTDFLAVSYDTSEKAYRYSVAKDKSVYKAGEALQLRLIYGMPHLETENFEALGFLKDFFNGTALQLFLEYCLVAYSNYKLGLEQSTEFSEALTRVSSLHPTANIANIRSFLRLYSDVNMKPIFDTDTLLSDVLEFAYKLFTTGELNDNIRYVPVIASLNATGKLNLSCFVITKVGDKHFKIEESVTSEPVNGDLISSLIATPFVDGFQVTNSLFTSYSESLNKYQTLLPRNATGLPRNVKINTLFQAIKNNNGSVDIGLASTTADEFFTSDVIESKQKFLEEFFVDGSGRSEAVMADTLENVLGNLNLNKIIVDSNTLQTGNRLFKLSDTSRYFKEAYTSNLTFSLEKAKASSADIETCKITFEQPFELEKDGYLYIKDIKVPTKRTSYAPNREIKILDRSFKATDLNIVGYKQESGKIKLVLQDDASSYSTATSRVIDAIRPKDLNVSEQDLKNENLCVGFKWIDPKVDISYTYYKRKFIFEGSISDTDTTTVRLADDNLALAADSGAFNLQDHVSPGDELQLYLADPVSYYQDGKTVTLNLFEGKGFKGPYKIIDTKTIGEGQNANIYAILAGPGNLVQVKIPLQNSVGVEIGKPLVFDNGSYAFALASGEIVYYNTLENATYQIAIVPDYTDNFELELELPAFEVRVPVDVLPEIDSMEPSSDGTVTVCLTVDENSKEAKLCQTHDTWYKIKDMPMLPTEEELPEAETDEEGIRSSESVPMFACATVPVDQGLISFDNYDRIYLEPANIEDASSWLALPDKVESFDATGCVNAFELTNDSGRKTVYKVEDADAETLQLFIRDRLSKIFVSGATGEAELNLACKELEAKIASDGSYAGISADELAQFKGESSTSFNLGDNDTVNNALVTVARMLSKQNNGNWNPKTGTVYLPVLEEIDVPVYFKADTEPKWQKSYQITGTTNTKLEDADVEQLAVFAKAILPIENVYRAGPNVTSYAKSSKHKALWDQETATLTVLDRANNLVSRLAVPDVALKHSVLSNGVTEDERLTKAIVRSGCLYVKSSGADVQRYFDSVKDDEIYAQLGLLVESNNIKINKDAELYISELLKDYKDVDFDNDEAYQDFDKDVLHTVKQLSDETEYEAWLRKTFARDFLCTNISRYAGLENDEKLAHLQQFFGAIGNDSLATTLEKIAQVIASSMDNPIIKGLPTITDELVSNRLGAISLTGTATKNFESLIKYSSVDIQENYVQIFGTIDWPSLVEVSTKVSNTLRLIYNSTDIPANILDAMSEVLAESARAELEYKYAAFYGSLDYEAGEKPFKVIVDLDTETVKAVQTQVKVNGKHAKLLSVVQTTDGAAYLTDAGTFSIGNVSDDVLSPDEVDISKFSETIDSSSAIVAFNAIKDLDVLSSVQMSADGTVTIQTRGALVEATSMIKTKVAYAKANELKLLHDKLVLDEGTTVNAIVMVKNIGKDNFQLGYGTVTGLNNLPVEYTVFEVGNADFADFVSYDNRISPEISVFDLYPTYEQIAEDKREHFYVLDDTGNVQYLTNKFGKNLLRINSLSESVTSSLIVIPNGNESRLTVANEWINDALFESLANEGKSTSSYILPESNLVNKSYETVIKQFNCQKAPKLVANPNDAIENYAYKVIEIAVDTSKDAKVNVLDDYIEIDVYSDTDFASQLDVGDAIATYASQVQAISEPDFVPMNVYASLESLELKIVNQSNSYPKLQPITRYEASEDANGNWRINTDSTDLYIPKSGYGQALFGEYTTPENCIFEDLTFFDSSKDTVNNSGESFRLVSENGQELSTRVPKLRFGSFAEADSELSIAVATKESPNYLKSALVDLSNFEITSNTLTCNQLHMLELLDLIDTKSIAATESNAANLKLYEMFQQGTQLACKVCYSKLKKDANADFVVDLTSESSDMTYVAELMQKLGTTRVYNNYQLPANVKYKAADGTYKLTSSLLTRNLNSYSTDPDGNLLYLDENGQISNTITVNTEPLCATRASSSITLLEVTDGNISTLVNNCFYYSKNCIILNKLQSKVSVGSNVRVGSILATCNPNKATSNYSSIQDITNDINAWTDSTKFRFEFQDLDNLQIDLTYSIGTDKKSYNFAYLKDINGKLLAKIFFEEGISDNTLLTIQKED